MYLKMPGETLNGNYESLTDDQLKQMLDTLKKELEKRQWTENPQRSWDQTNDADLNVDNVHLYSWWGKKLEKSGVLDVIKSLKGPYKTEVNWFVKGNDILGLQRYLNAKIDSGSIDKIKLESALSAKNIWLRGGHLLEDGKFWPQTMETIKVLAELPEGGAEEQGRQEAIAEENKDVEWLQAKRRNFERKNRNVYKVSTDKVPDSWTWTDEKKVYAVDLLTKTSGNPIVWGGKSIQYRFLNNGKCYRVVADSWEILQWPLDSTKVLAHLKVKDRPAISSSAEKNRTIDSIKQTCSDALVASNGDNFWIKLNRNWNPVVTLTYKTSWWISYDFEEPINLSSCLLNAQWEVDTYYTKIIIEEAKQALVKKKKTYKCWEAINRIYVVGDAKFTKEQLFRPDWLSSNPLVDARLNVFFAWFTNKQWELDRDFKYDVSRYQINLEFDNTGSNKSYNKWETNGNLLMRGADKLVDDNYNFKDEEFKNKLRDIILRTVTNVSDFWSRMNTPKYT